MTTIVMKNYDAKAYTDHDASGQASETVCVAIIWVSNGASNKKDKKILLSTVKRQTGVISARFSMKIPLLMIVDYTPEHTRASVVVKTINEYGPEMRARLVHPAHGRLVSLGVANRIDYSGGSCLPGYNTDPIATDARFAHRLGCDAGVVIDSDLYADLCAAE